jgi:acyl carrier protein
MSSPVPNPNADVERALASIWSDILGKPGVGPDDDFFMLGGDSILVMTLVMRVEEEFSLFLDPGELFDHPTLKTFAARIAQASLVDETLEAEGVV